MSKKAVLLFAMITMAVAGITLSACFNSPTSPTLLTSGGAASGGDSSSGSTGGDYPGGTGVEPTPTPITGGGNGVYTVSGTLANTGGGTCYVYAENGTSTRYTLVAAGQTTFTITNVSNGTYDVYAYNMTFSESTHASVTVNGANVSGVALTF